MELSPVRATLLTNKEPNDEECDARDDDQGTGAGIKKIKTKISIL